jgi:hypothetical protein
VARSSQSQDEAVGQSRMRAKELTRRRLRNSANSQKILKICANRTTRSGYGFSMKRFLIFTIIGPLIGIIGMTLISFWAAGMTPEAILLVLVPIAYIGRYFIVITSLLAWTSDLVLIHLEVKLPVRMATIAGVLAVLAAGLERMSLLLVVIAAMIGTIGAFCVWLSARLGAVGQNETHRTGSMAGNPVRQVRAFLA